MDGRTTRQRLAVMRALADCEDFVSAQALHNLLVENGIRVGLTTVYRALRDLEASGGADVVRDDAGERLYRTRPADGHRHYLLCRACGRSRPVDSAIVEEWAGRIAASTGYAAMEHTVELTGICTTCQPSGEEGEPPCRLERAPDTQGRARNCVS
ncbi:Fur family transcriptional regulator [Streptomyces lanatus]|uniref:Fur family transcriptional regulator n=1 Tax=Streptomyces lanatus TaxID=66900 RepID=A0ABV1XLT6_9ACTN|nr:Fur family transcriptional regulator [Streptomyces lanatus]GHG98979.1 transcriptional repressor [Streptomyces lanatus]